MHVAVRLNLVFKYNSSNLNTFNILLEMQKNSVDVLTYFTTIPNLIFSMKKSLRFPVKMYNFSRDKTTY